MLKYLRADVADYTDLLEIAKAQRVFTNITLILRRKKIKDLQQAVYLFFLPRSHGLIILQKLGSLTFFIRALVTNYSTMYNFIADKIFAP